MDEIYKRIADQVRYTYHPATNLLDRISDRNIVLAAAAGDQCVLDEIIKDMLNNDITISNIIHLIREVGQTAGYDIHLKDAWHYVKSIKKYQETEREQEELEKRLQQEYNNSNEIHSKMFHE